MAIALYPGRIHSVVRVAIKRTDSYKDAKSQNRRREFSTAKHFFPTAQHPILFEDHLATRAPPPFMTFSTSANVAIEVSPGVVIASAP